jgi:hypothetical protein
MKISTGKLPGRPTDPCQIRRSKHLPGFEPLQSSPWQAVWPTELSTIHPRSLSNQACYQLRSSTHTHIYIPLPCAKSLTINSTYSPHAHNIVLASDWPIHRDVPPPPQKKKVPTPSMSAKCVHYIAQLYSGFTFCVPTWTVRGKRERERERKRENASYHRVVQIKKIT